MTDAAFRQSKIQNLKSKIGFYGSLVRFSHTVFALPFALRAGREPALALQLLGWGPLAVVPLSLAYAVVKHRLMDVELLFRRGIATCWRSG